MDFSPKLWESNNHSVSISLTEVHYLILWSEAITYRRQAPICMKRLKSFVCTALLGKLYTNVVKRSDFDFMQSWFRP